MPSVIAPDYGQANGKQQRVGHTPCDVPTRPVCVSPIGGFRAHEVLLPDDVDCYNTQQPHRHQVSGLWHSEGVDRSSGRGRQSGGILSLR